MYEPIHVICTHPLCSLRIMQNPSFLVFDIKNQFQNVFFKQSTTVLRTRAWMVCPCVILLNSNPHQPLDHIILHWMMQSWWWLGTNLKTRLQGVALRFEVYLDVNSSQNGFKKNKKSLFCSKPKRSISFFMYYSLSMLNIMEHRPSKLVEYPVYIVLHNFRRG